jgi:hypothetical protein
MTMRKPDLTLATADEATQPLEKLRSGLLATSGKPTMSDVLDIRAFLKTHPGSLLYEIAEALSLKVRDAEVATRELMRAGLAQRAASEDGITRYWPAKESP